MSLNVDAGLAVPPQPRAPGAAVLSGLPALFAALLAGQTQAGEPPGVTGTASPVPKGAESTDKEGDKPDPAPDPNAALMLAASALPPPIVVQTAVTTSPKAAASDQGPTALTEKNREVMDIAAAPVSPDTQSSELLPQSTTETPAPETALPAAAPLAILPKTGSVALPAALPEKGAVATSAVLPKTGDVATPAALPGKETAALPVVASIPMPVGTGDKPRPETSPSASRQAVIPAVPPVGTSRAASPAAPSQGASSSAPLSPTQAAPAQTSPVQAPSVQTATLPQQISSAPVLQKNDTDISQIALKKPVGPANNTGRGLPAGGSEQRRAAQAAPAQTAAADVFSQEQIDAVSPALKETKSASEGTGSPDGAEAFVPAQASSPSTAAPSASARSEKRGTAAAQVAEKIVSLPLAPGTTRQVTVNLHPHDWGQVRVEVTMTAPGADGTAGAITARLSADNPQARAALQTHSGELRRALEDAGLRLDSVTITDTVQAASGSAASGGDSTPFRQEGQAAFTGSPNSGTTFGGGGGSAASSGQETGGGRQRSYPAPSGAGQSASDTTTRSEPMGRTTGNGVDIHA